MKHILPSLEGKGDHEVVDESTPEGKGDHEVVDESTLEGKGADRKSDG